MCGTTEYMAPEILQSKGHKKDADWWSVWILLYEMLTGQVQFEFLYSHYFWSDFPIFVHTIRFLFMRPPFRHEKRKKLQRRIIQEKVNLPPFLCTEAHSLLKGLLQKEPSRRLGSWPSGGDEIKKHKWFRSINWKKLEKFSPRSNQM
ncbi:hypothetical protein REPUB_Repub08aG0080100 [Reevesia pubescens]